MRRPVFAWFAFLFVLSAMVAVGWLRPLDAAVTEWIRAHPNPNLDWLARQITFFGSSAWFVSVMLVWSGLLFTRGKRTAVRRLWVAWLAGLAIQAGLRLVVAQWRPDVAMLPQALSLWQRYDLAGFTSGHAYRAAFLAFGMRKLHAPDKRLWVRVLTSIACILAVGVALTRVYLLRHWVTDALGAALLAAAIIRCARLDGNPKAR